MTADDLLFTFVQLVQATEARGLPYPWYYSNLLDVNSIIIESPYKVRIRMNSLSVFAFHWIGGNIILPKHIWQRIFWGDDMTPGTLDDNQYDPETFAPDPGLIGQGPFKVYPHSIDKTDYYVPYSHVKMDAYIGSGHHSSKPVRPKAKISFDWALKVPKIGIRVLNWARKQASAELYVTVNVYTDWQKQFLIRNYEELITASISSAPGIGGVPGWIEPIIDISTMPDGYYDVYVGVKASILGWEFTRKEFRVIDPYVQPTRLVAGDVNLDNVVDITDATMLSVQFGLRSWVWLELDINDDGLINLGDASLILANWSV